MCAQLSNGKGIKQYAYFSYETEEAYDADLQNALEVFISDNHYDNNNNINEELSVNICWQYTAV